MPVHAVDTGPDLTEVPVDRSRTVRAAQSQILEQWDSFVIGAIGLRRVLFVALQFHLGGVDRDGERFLRVFEPRPWDRDGVAVGVWARLSQLVRRAVGELFDPIEHDRHRHHGDGFAIGREEKAAMVKWRDIEGRTDGVVEGRRDIRRVEDELLLVAICSECVVRRNVVQHVLIRNRAFANFRIRRAGVF